MIGRLVRWWKSGWLKERTLACRGAIGRALGWQPMAGASEI